MSIPSGAIRKAGPSAGNGSTTAFPFAFSIFQASDLLVVLTDSSGNQATQTLNSQYTVALNGGSAPYPGGTVNFLTAPATGYTVTIGSQEAQVQTTTLTNGGGFFPTVLNSVLDYLTVLVQGLNEKLSRTLSLPFSTAASVSATLPAPQANSVFGWNAAANAIVNTQMQTGTSLVNLAGSAGSSLVGFIQGGAGAVGRTVQSRLRDFLTVNDLGADPTGVVDSTSAFNNASGIVFAPQGTYKTDSVVTGGKPIISLNALFTGINPVTSWLPAFGANDLVVMEFLGGNAFVGAVDNKQPVNSSVFPTGVTGYGVTNNAGNQAFGVFGRADLYNTGVATNEFNSFNYSGQPASSNLPPNRSIGTTQYHPIALTVAAGGTSSNSIGIHIAQEGSTLQKFLCGIYIDQTACVNYGLFIDSGSSNGVAQPLLVKGAVANVLATLQPVGTFAANNAVFAILSATDSSTQMSIKQDGHLSFNSGISQSTIGVAGAASALPANPTGYLHVEVGGFLKAIPYYEH